MIMNEFEALHAACIRLADREMESIAATRGRYDTTFIHMIVNTSTDVWRVKIGPFVSVLHLRGGDLVPTTSRYEDESLLPEWMQDRIMALRMINCEDPTEYITGLGRRISPDTFWLET